MKPSEKYRLNERNHVEKPLLDQLSGLGWEIIDLTEEKQTPGHTFRDNFTGVFREHPASVQWKDVSDNKKKVR